MWKYILIIIIVFIGLLILSSLRSESGQSRVKSSSVSRAVDISSYNHRVRDTEFYRETQKVQPVIRKMTDVKPKALNLNLESLGQEIVQLIDKANILAGNIHPSQFRQGEHNLRYNQDLWYKAQKAGVSFLTAANLVQEKLDELHRIDFKDISSSDRRLIKELQSSQGLISLKKALIKSQTMMFRKTVTFKELIRNGCGDKGLSWAQKMDESGRAARAYS